MAMFAPFIAGIFADIGITGGIAAAGAELGLSAGASEAAAGAVAGAGANAVSGTISNGISSGIDSAFGAGTSSNISNTVSTTKNQASDIGSALLSGSYEDLMKKKLEEVKLKRQQQRNQALLNQVSGAVQVPNAGSVAGPGVSVTSGLDNTNPLSGLEVLSNGTSGTSDGAVSSVVSNAVSSPQDPQIPQGTDQEKVKQIAQDLGTFINGSTTDVLKNKSRNPGTNMTNVVNSYDELSGYLGPGIANYVQNANFADYLPTNDTYKKISEVYNGSRIVPQSVHQEPNPSVPGMSIFGAFEEDGNPVFYYQHEGTTLRPIWPGHVWTGPQSPNSGLPVDLWDAFSYYHDSGYQTYGWFDRISDYKYISRLAQGLRDNRFPQIQRDMIKNTIMYFSTVGSALSLFNNDKNPNRVSDSQFQYQTPESDSGSPGVHFVNYVDPTINLDEPLKKLFTDTLTSTVAQEFATTSPINTITNSQSTNELQLLKSINIGLM